MDDLSNDFEELLAFLNAHRVRAIVVGGHALAFHGHPRYTKDLDVFVEPSPENAEALLGALSAFGFGSIGLTADDFAPGKVVQLGIAPNRIDLMTAIDGVSFSDAWEGGSGGHRCLAVIVTRSAEPQSGRGETRGRPEAGRR